MLGSRTAARPASTAESKELQAVLQSSISCPFLSMTVVAPDCEPGRLSKFSRRSATFRSSAASFLRSFAGMLETVNL